MSGAGRRAAAVGILLISLLAASAAAEDRGAAAEVRVPVRHVALFSSGVGYFEHGGEVEGDGRAELRFRTEQINDLLKSLVLLDLDGGQVGTVVYPSNDPLSKTLASFQVDLSSNPTLAGLLGQLRGAAVTVQAQGKEQRGQILGVEKQLKHVGNQEFIDQWRMTLLSEGSVRALAIEDVQSIRLEDAELQDELNRALAALAQARDQDDKPLTLEFRGQGRRRVRVAYVVEAPVWKTSYRLILGEGAGSARLQGWALVENQTDQDWTDIELSLVSGRPLSFVQELYEPRYIKRPVVEPVAFNEVDPQRYARGKVDEEYNPVASIQRLENFELFKHMRSGSADGVYPMSEDGAEGQSGGIFGGQGSAGFASVQAAATGLRVGELFSYQVGRVTLPRQRSAMIPIVTEPVEVQRVSILNAQVLATHPLLGVRLTNSTSNHLLAGPVSVFDGGGYAGDASVEDLPPGENRLLSYAIDLETHVQIKPEEPPAELRSGQIIKGVLQTEHRFVSRATYDLENTSSQKRLVLIEHPLRAGWSLVDTPAPAETTADRYRFEVELPANGKKEFTVREERVESQSLVLLDGAEDQLVFYETARGLSAELRAGLQGALQRRRDLAATREEIGRQRAQIHEVTKEQERIRANLQSVAQGTDYHSRLLRKLDDQETRIEQLQSQIAQLDARAAAQLKELEDYLEGLSVR